MPSVLPNGIGGNVADKLVTASPLILSSPARVWYVDSQSGVAGNTGKDRKFPFEQIGEAITAIGANDDHIVVCLSGHVQTVDVGILPQRVSIVGEGATAGIPDVTIKGREGECSPFFVINADGVEIRNILFSGTSGAFESNHCGWISASNAAGCRIVGCVFDMDPGMTIEAGVSLGTGSDDWLFENCTWRAVSETYPATDRPLPGLHITAAISRLSLNGCVFDGGLNGFDDGSGNPYSLEICKSAGEHGSREGGVVGCISLDH